MIRLLIRKWDWRRDRLQATAEHDVISSIWARQRCELSCANLNGGCQFHAKSYGLIGTFLACPPDWALRSSTVPRQTRSAAAWLKGKCTRLADSLQQTIDASKFPSLSGKFTEQPSCTASLDRFRFLKTRIASTCKIFIISRAPSVSCATRLMFSICLFIFLSGNIFRTAEPISTKVCTVTATG